MESSTSPGVGRKVSASDKDRKLCMVSGKVNGSDVGALLGTGVWQNITSRRLCEELHRSKIEKSHSITVADGTCARVLSELKGLPVKFENLTVPFTFLVLADSPLDLVIWAQRMEIIDASLEMGRFSAMFSIFGGTGVQYK